MLPGTGFITLQKKENLYLRKNEHFRESLDVNQGPSTGCVHYEYEKTHSQKEESVYETKRRLAFLFFEPRY